MHLYTQKKYTKLNIEYYYYQHERRPLTSTDIQTSATGKRESPFQITIIIVYKLWFDPKKIRIN